MTATPLSLAGCVETAQKPAAESTSSKDLGVKCVRCRGRSRGNHADPNRSRCQQAKFGTVITSKPPGRNTRCTRSSSAGVSGTCSREWLMTTTSNDSSSYRIDPSVPTLASMPRARAIAHADAEGSTPTTRQPWRTNAAPMSPRPQPTSSSEPGCILATSPSGGRARARPRISRWPNPCATPRIPVSSPCAG